MTHGGMCVLVTGATGKQGGAVARLLLKRGHRVHALTRNAQSPAAQELGRLGAKLIVGDLLDRKSLETALQAVEAVFLMTTGLQAGVEGEIRQGMVMADAAKAQNRFVVFTSVASAHQNTGIPHFDSKWRIEQYLQKIGVPSAVIGPVYFMENLQDFFSDFLKAGRYANPLKGDTKLQQIALKDIAAFAVWILENWKTFEGKRIDLASDTLSGQQASDILTQVSGHRMEYFQIPINQIRDVSHDLATMYEWLEHTGFSVDITALRRDYPQIHWHSYESWAQEQNWDMLTHQTTAADRGIK